MGVSHCGAGVGAYRFQEGLRLVKAIKLFVLHHQEMSSIDDYSFQPDEGTQQSKRKKSRGFFAPPSKISQAHKIGLFSNPQIRTCYRSRWQRSLLLCQLWHRDAGTGQQTVWHLPTDHNLISGSVLPSPRGEHLQLPSCRESQPPWKMLSGCYFWAQ